MCVCVRVCVYLYVCVCVCLCVRVYVCVSSTHVIKFMRIFISARSAFAAAP